MPSSVVGPRRSSKVLPKANMYQKRSWFGDMLPVSSTIAFCVHAKLLQSCLTLCDPVDCSTPDSSVHWILQARMLGWFARLSSEGLPDPGIEPGSLKSPALAGRLPLVPLEKPIAFWIPVKPLHLRSMLRKWMRGTENCNTWSWHWSTERAQFSTTPDCMSQPILQKLNRLVYEVLPHLLLSPDLLPASYLFFKHLDTYWQWRSFHNQKEAKMLSKSLLNLEVWIFMLQE